jgi:hypothetical protein
LLQCEVSPAMVSQSSLKTGGRVAWMVHVALSWRSHGDEAKDGWVDATGYVGPFNPKITVFLILAHWGSLFFCFFL